MREHLAALGFFRVDLDDHHLPFDVGHPVKVDEPLTTVTSLRNCLTICSMICSSPLVVMVMRETPSSRVGATLSDSMLKPRPLNNPATRERTPGPSLQQVQTKRAAFFLQELLKFTQEGNTYTINISSSEAPAGTMGETFSSLSTSTSITAVLGEARALGNSSSSSSSVVMR